MAHAREQRAAQGLPIHAGEVAAASAEEDGQAYLDHVRRNAAEIATAGPAARDDDAAAGKRDDSSPGAAPQQAPVSGGGAAKVAARQQQQQHAPQQQQEGRDDAPPADQALDMPALELVGDVDLTELD